MKYSKQTGRISKFMLMLIIGGIAFGAYTAKKKGMLSSKTIISGHQSSTIQSQTLLAVSIISVALISLIALYLAESIGKALGVTGLNIATRIMGLVLAAIGVQMIAQGLIVLLPGLAG